MRENAKQGHQIICLCSAWAVSFSEFQTGIEPGAEHVLLRCVVGLLYLILPLAMPGWFCSIPEHNRPGMKKIFFPGLQN